MQQILKLGMIGAGFVAKFYVRAIMQGEQRTVPIRYVFASASRDCKRRAKQRQS